MTVEKLKAAGRKRREPTGDWRDALSRTDKGQAHSNMFNACVALRHHPDLAGLLAYNEFAGCAWTRGPLPWDKHPDRPWSEFDDIKATEWLQSPKVGIQVGSSTAREAIQAVAYERRFHPVLKWLETLVWDGEDRLTEWLTTYFGVPSTPLTRAFGRKFLISAVARVMRPGCKVDHVLILEGLQGAMKSKSLRALAGDHWFADQIADLGTKDSYQDLLSVWIVELSELSAIRPGEVEKIKAYISRQIDHYRPSYGRRSIDVPRQCVFIGTTNSTEYLSDTTGNRRYWPVTCTKLDPDALARDRDQIWAQATAAFHAGEDWWLKDNDLRVAADAEQEQRRIEDPWEAIIDAWVLNPQHAPERDGTRMPMALPKADFITGESLYVTIRMILENATCKPVERQTTTDQMRVGRILKRLGWSKHKTRTRNVWLPPEEEVSTASHPQNGQKGVHTDQVSTLGVHPETRSDVDSVDTVDTVDTADVDTYRAHTHAGVYKVCGNGIHGIQVSTAGAGDDLPDDDEHASWLRGSRRRRTPRSDPETT